MNELLAKGATELSTAGAGFYLNVFVVHICMLSKQPILYFEQFNHFMHIATF